MEDSMYKKLLDENKADAIKDAATIKKEATAVISALKLFITNHMGYSVRAIAFDGNA
jgi:hypothetical protein